MAATVVSMFLLFLLPFAEARITNASQGQYRSSLIKHYYKPVLPRYQGLPYYQYLQIALQNPFALYNLDPIRYNPNRKLTPPYFPIHGLWPTNSSGGVLVSVENCTFPNYWLPEKLERSLDSVWFDATDRRDTRGFREYEYQKHGSCTNTNPNLPSAEIYFETALDWYNKILLDKVLAGIIKNGSPVPSGDYLRDISNAIGGNQPILYCNKRNSKGYRKGYQQLREVIICLNQAATGYTPCRATKGLVCSGYIYYR